ncbi:hypothetical protein HMPREF2550_06515 [Corynebacterium sp. HMSC074A01]|nr:hypothetical protein HMPREF2550_06515 [Corynebacterium sp. HMSC074A01]
MRHPLQIMFSTSRTLTTNFTAATTLIPGIQSLKLALGTTGLFFLETGERDTQLHLHSYNL